MATVDVSIRGPAGGELGHVSIQHDDVHEAVDLTVAVLSKVLAVDGMRPSSLVITVED